MPVQAIMEFSMLHCVLVLAMRCAYISWCACCAPIPGALYGVVLLFVVVCCTPPSIYRALKIKCEIFSAATDGSYLRIVSIGTVCILWCVNPVYGAMVCGVYL